MSFQFRNRFQPGNHDTSSRDAACLPWLDEECARDEGVEDDGEDQLCETFHLSVGLSQLEIGLIGPESAGRGRRGYFEHEIPGSQSSEQTSEFW